MENSKKDIPDDEDRSHYYKLGIFYFNPDDKRPFPPKRCGGGWDGTGQIHIQ